MRYSSGNPRFNWIILEITNNVLVSMSCVYVKKACYEDDENIIYYFEIFRCLSYHQFIEG